MDKAVVRYFISIILIIMITACATEEDAGNIVPMFDNLKQHHQSAMNDFRKELVLFGEQTKKDKEISVIMSQGHLTDRDKEKLGKQFPMEKRN